MDLLVVLDMLAITGTFGNFQFQFESSFWVAAFVIYRLRCVYGYHNLAHALEERYGKLAAMAFGLTVAIRLYNEVIFLRFLLILGVE